jgi:hypothetical protein
MYLPQIDDERATLCGFLEVQLDAIRAAAYGLDDAQARQSPVRSVLSISGILKHSIFIMKQSLSGAGHREHDHSSGLGVREPNKQVIALGDCKCLKGVESSGRAIPPDGIGCCVDRRSDTAKFGRKYLVNFGQSP